MAASHGLQDTIFKGLGIDADPVGACILDHLKLFSRNGIGAACLNGVFQLRRGVKNRFVPRL